MSAPTMEPSRPPAGPSSPPPPRNPAPLPSPAKPTPPSRPSKALPILGLIAALAAIALLAVIWFMSTLWATTRSLYYVPDSGDITSALVIALLMVSTVVSLILAPKPRPSRHLFVRTVRAVVLRGRHHSSTSGPATAPAQGWPGAVAPTPGTPARTSPAGGRAGLGSPSLSPSPTWRSAA